MVKIRVWVNPIKIYITRWRRLSSVFQTDFLQLFYKYKCKNDNSRFGFLLVPMLHKIYMSTLKFERKTILCNSTVLQNNKMSFKSTHLHLIFLLVKWKWWESITHPVIFLVIWHLTVNIQSHAAQLLSTNTTNWLWFENVNLCLSFNGILHTVNPLKLASV